MSRLKPLSKFSFIYNDTCAVGKFQDKISAFKTLY